MTRRTKLVLMIIPAVCVAALFAVYCTQVEYNNPIDPNFSYTLNVILGEGNGSVSLDPEETSYPGGTNVTVTAIPGENYKFAGWSEITSEDSVVTIRMDGNKELTANFAVSCTTNVNCADDIGSCTVGGICRDNVQRGNCEDPAMFAFGEKCPPPELKYFSDTVNGWSFNMVLVEGGKFTMGCNDEQDSDCGGDERPAHQVTLTNDFYIGEFEVTQGLWKAVMGNDNARLSSINNSSINYGRGDSIPMYYVSWNDAQAFIESLKSLTNKRYRLPTEAEWEFAARGGNYREDFKYAGSDTIDEVAWYLSNRGGSSQAKPVGAKAANALGLFDMSGSVREWVYDWYGGEYTEADKINPTGSATGSQRVLRGGDRNSHQRDCRVSSRDSRDPENRSTSIGFRLVWSVEYLE